MTLEEAKLAADCWMRPPMLIPLDEQVRIVRYHSNTVRQMLVDILRDDRQWARICAQGDRRLIDSAAQYGDRSFHKTPAELRIDLEEELIDARAYGGMLLERELGR